MKKVLIKNITIIVLLAVFEIAIYALKMNNVAISASIGILYIPLYILAGFAMGTNSFKVGKFDKNCKAHIIICVLIMICLFAIIFHPIIPLFRELLRTLSMTNFRSVLEILFGYNLSRAVFLNT